MIDGSGALIVAFSRDNLKHCPCGGGVDLPGFLQHRRQDSFNRSWIGSTDVIYFA